MFQKLCFFFKFEIKKIIVLVFSLFLNNLKILNSQFVSQLYKTFLNGKLTIYIKYLLTAKLYAF